MALSPSFGFQVRWKSFICIKTKELHVVPKPELGLPNSLPGTNWQWMSR